MLKRFDKDSDGKLNDEERAAARKAFEARRGGGSGNRGPRGDGAGQGRPDREKMRAAMLKRFDNDGDGKLNGEERATMRKQLDDLRGGRGGPGRAGNRDRPASDADAGNPDEGKSDDAKPDESKSSEAPPSTVEPGEKPGSE